MRNPLCLSVSGKWRPAADLPMRPMDSLMTEDMEGVSFLLIDGTDPRAGYEQLQQIRSNTHAHIYTKPVLFFDMPENASNEMLQAADGIIHGSGEDLDHVLSLWSAKAETINTRIHYLKILSPEGDRNIAFKVLRFIETRNTGFHPVPSIRTKDGYLYPSLQPFFPKQDIGILETLEYLESQKLLSGEFITRSYACTHCGCAFLNFHETCPDCGSGDLHTDELIHHFKCAYVGELADFRQGDYLVCPKCDRRLKHIGVDYDKASIVYRCRNCSKVFQEPMVMTSCFNCHRDTEPENQQNREIKTYQITAIGENAARYGMDSLLRVILETKIHALPFDVFKNFFSVEVARIERYKVSQSCLVILRIRGIDQIYGRLGGRATEIFKELSEAFKKSLRSSDMFSVRDETVFLTILTETNKKNAGVAVSRLKGRILALLEASMKSEFTVDEVILPLSSDVDLEEAIELFLKSHAD